MKTVIYGFYLLFHELLSLYMDVSRTSYDMLVLLLRVASSCLLFLILVGKGFGYG
jgi:hypothetical protein